MLDGDLDPERTAFIQVAPPTRAKVKEYQKIRDDVELLVSRANGPWGRWGRTRSTTCTRPWARRARRPVPRGRRDAGDPARSGRTWCPKDTVAAKIDGRGAWCPASSPALQSRCPGLAGQPLRYRGMKSTIMAALGEPPRTHVPAWQPWAGVITDDVASAADFLTSSSPPDPSMSPELRDALAARGRADGAGGPRLRRGRSRPSSRCRRPPGPSPVRWR